jgi:hypothetical protein
VKRSIAVGCALSLLSYAIVDVTVSPAQATSCPASGTTIPVTSDFITLSLAGCNAVGTRITDGIATVALPPSGSSVHAFVLTTTSDDELAVVTLPDGDVQVNPPAPVAMRPANQAARPLTSDPACSEDEDAFDMSLALSTTVSWSYNSQYSPHSDAAVTGATTAGANAWYIPTTNCTPMYNSSPGFSYAGTTSIRPSVTTATTCSGADGHNVTGWTSLPAGYLGVTCNYGSGGSRETDLAYNSSGLIHYFFATVPSGCGSPTAYFDFQGVAAHERGHSYGMLHAPAGGNDETMYGALSSCTTKYETLGYGDMAGAKSLYP